MEPLFAIKPESVAIVDADSKQEILAQLSALFARTWDLDAELVLELLDEREKLGSTGFGRGVAIPHARIPGIQRPVAALLRLNHAAEFGAADGLPVAPVPAHHESLVAMKEAYYETGAVLTHLVR